MKHTWIPSRTALAGRGLAFWLLSTACLASAPTRARAQQLTYTKGRPLYPAYEGWRQADDGSYVMLFGYMNENWEQEVDVPVGPENHFSPGPADRGQPTHFLPRRNRFIFEVSAPPDFGEDDELVWTVKANGQEYSAYGTIREDLFLDNVVIMSETGALGAGTSSPEIRANEPPVVQLEGDTERQVRVGEPLELVALVTDDGQPARDPRRRLRGGDDTEAPDPPTPREQLERALRAPTATVTVSKRVRLYFTWFVYRGEGDGVEIEPPQVKPWEDTRAFANSPWAISWDPPEIPEDGRWRSVVTFSEPGTYLLRGRADDGGLYSDVDVTVHVGPRTPSVSDD